MMEISHDIFGKIMSFKWSLAADSFDYPKKSFKALALIKTPLKATLGAGSGYYKRCTSTPIKLKMKAKDKIEQGGTFSEGGSTRDDHLAVQDMIGTCNRDHSDDGCKDISLMIESKYRHNIADPRIK